jgi:hypothetical protein
LRDGETGSGLTARSWLLIVDVGADPEERDADPEDDDVDANRRGTHEFLRRQENDEVLGGNWRTLVEVSVPRAVVVGEALPPGPLLIRHYSEGGLDFVVHIGGHRQWRDVDRQDGGPRKSSGAG